MAFRTLSAIICLLLAIPSHATAQQSLAEDAAFADVQKHFAEAYNNKNVDAMAAAFTENGIRVTPSGIFQGRDAIRRNLQEVLNMGLHDYTVRRTISRLEGNFVSMPGSGRPSSAINLSTAITPRSLSARVIKRRSWKRRLLSPHLERKWTCRDCAEEVRFRKSGNWASTSIYEYEPWIIDLSAAVIITAQQTSQSQYKHRTSRGYLA